LAVILPNGFFAAKHMMHANAIRVHKPIFDVRGFRKISPDGLFDKRFF